MFAFRKFSFWLLSFIVLLTMVFSTFQPLSASAQGSDGIQRNYNAESGKVTHITGTGNEPIILMGAMSTDMTPAERSDILVERFAPEFGLTSSSEELTLADESQPEADRVVTKYQQVYQGVPVLGGELIVNASDKGEMYSMNGEVSQGLSLDTNPAISVETAIDIARQGMTKWYGGSKSDYQHTDASLYIFDESILRPSIRPAELVWKIEMTPVQQGQPVRELVLVNARTGNIPLHFNQVDTGWAETQAEPIVQYQDPVPTETPTPLPTETPVPTATPTPAETPILTETTQPEDGSSSIYSDGGVTIQSGAAWYVATTGDDTNSCSSAGSPCLTINGAIVKATSGDTIKVATGTYTGSGGEVVFINKNIALLGGWNTNFTVQDGMSTLDGEKARRVISTYEYSGKIVSLDRFIIQNGRTFQYGGGIKASNASLTLNNSSVINNVAVGNGGGILISGNLILNNSTVSGNEAGSGGGISISNNGTDATLVTINNSTIADNLADQGGGLIISYYATQNNVTLINSIVAGNAATTGSDCSGIINTSSHNIIGDTTDCIITAGAGDQFSVDPLISEYPIGTSDYHALLDGSPAIDAGDSATCLTKDQRGVTRPQGSVCDIGAYEYKSPSTATSFGISAGSNQHVVPGLAFPVPFVVYVVDSDGSPVSGVNVTYTTPVSGASGTFEGSGNSASVETNNSGLAIAPVFTSNSQSGSYNVTATVSGLPGSVEFALINAIWADADWFVAPTGSDSNSCNSPESPCLTINYAITKAASGEKIKVAAGIYTGMEIRYRDVIISGGWDPTFENQIGGSIIKDDGVLINSGSWSNLLNVALDHFSIQNGGVYLGYSPTVILNNITISGNDGGIYGGGINMSSGTLTINNSTITGNKAGDYGGGVYVASGSLTIQNSTIANNSSTTGGGIYNSNGTLVLRNSILVNNTATTGPDCSGVINTSEYNIIGNSSGCTVTATPGNQFNIDPMLGTFLPLQGYYPLLSGSPAINAGNSGSCLPTDQRGVARVGTCDMGSYEYTAPSSVTSLSIVDGDGQRTPPNFNFVLPLKVVALDSQGSPVPSVSVTFTAPASGASGIFAGTGSRSTSVDTDESGIATTSIFTANNQLGSYIVSASASGAGSADINLENAAWYVSTSGYDTNSCVSTASPCATINGAIGKAPAGDTILVSSGAYTGTGSEVVLINKSITLSGSWDSNFTTQSGVSVIDGQGLRRGITIPYGTAVTVVIEQFTIQNGSTSDGGGILNNTGNDLTINDTTITGNTVTNYGGGIINSGNLILNNSTVSGNIALGSSSRGGGVYSGNITLNNSTISNNSSGWLGGGIYINGTLNTKNSILANNTASVGPDCYTYTIGGGGVVTSNGYNIFGNNSECTFTPTTGDQVGTSSSPIKPRLTPLQDNGGPAFTHALLVGSPAIDAGNPATPGSGGNACLATDQRGVARPDGTRCDIGAFEGSVPWVPSPYVSTYTANNSSTLPGTFLCNQSQQPCTTDPVNSHANAAHEYAIGTYNFYARRRLRLCQCR